MSTARPLVRSSGARRRQPWLGVLFPGVLALAACGPDAGDTAAAGETATIRPATPSASVDPSAPVDTVNVALLEYVIGMPSTLPAGRLALRLSNQGFELHNLKILAEDGTLVWETEREVFQGQTRVDELDLAPGTYTVLCDVAGHDSKGMLATIEVVERPDG